MPRELDLEHSESEQAPQHLSRGAIVLWRAAMSRGECGSEGGAAEHQKLRRELGRRDVDQPKRKTPDDSERHEEREAVADHGPMGACPERVMNQAGHPF